MRECRFLAVHPHRLDAHCRVEAEQELRQRRRIRRPELHIHGNRQFATRIHRHVAGHAFDIRSGRGLQRRVGICPGNTLRPTGNRVADQSPDARSARQQQDHTPRQVRRSGLKVTSGQKRRGHGHQSSTERQHANPLHDVLERGNTGQDVRTRQAEVRDSRHDRQQIERRVEERPEHDRQQGKRDQGHRQAVAQRSR